MVHTKFKYLIADTTAFINNVQLNEYAENILTVPDVVNEVKSKRQLKRLVVLPFDLQVEEPDADALAYVTHFSKQTGDYASLSVIDLKVIALSYQLEKTHVGTDHLRKAPVVARIVASKSKPEELQEKTPLVGFYNPSEGEGEEDADTQKEDNESEVSVKAEENEDKSDSDPTEEDEITEEQLKACFEKLSCMPEEDEDNSVLVPEYGEKSADAPTEDTDASDGEEDEDFGEDEQDDDEDGGGWITPSNIQKKKKEMSGDLEEEKPAIVACMTTDFAIQNVLKQINLNVAALNGRVIRHLKTYILRCYACFKTTSIVTKAFCPNCGNRTLKRVAVSLDENGQQVIHINTRRPLTAKFKNQSLPRARGGKHSQNPILFEDQPLPKQMPSRVAKTKTNALDEDYIAGYSPFVMRDVDSRSALLRSKGNLKQWARNNAYEEDRRRKSSNRLAKQ